MQHPGIGHDDAKSAVTFREMRNSVRADRFIGNGGERVSGDENRRLDLLGGAGNGFGKDANAHFANLRLWRSLNQGGISHADELFALTSQAIAANIRCKDRVMTTIRLLSQLLLTLLAALGFGGCEANERSPYPVIESGLTVPDGEPASQVRNFRWLDNNRLITLVVDRIEILPKGYTKVRQSLKVWDVASNTVTTLAEPDVGGLCVGEGFIRYYVKRTVENGKEVLDRYFGPVGQVKQVVLSGPLDSLTCKLKSEVRLPDWALAIPDVNIRRLRPEHGFLVIDRDSVDQAPRALRFYRAGSTKDQVADLSNLLGDSPKQYPMIFLRYFEYKKAYLLNAIALGQTDKWLFHDGSLVEAWPAFQSGDLRVPKTTFMPLVPTKTVRLSGANAFDKTMIGHGGLYAILNPKAPIRLVKGRIGKEIEVSPNGCMAAFANDSREKIGWDQFVLHQLQVINLCPESEE